MVNYIFCLFKYTMHLNIPSIESNQEKKPMEKYSRIITRIITYSRIITFAFIIVMIVFGPVLPSFMLSTLLFPLLHRNLVLVFANDLECLVLVQFLKYEFIQLSTTRVKEHLFSLYFFHPPI